MSVARLCSAFIIPLLFAACEPPPPELPSVPLYDTVALAAIHYKVVLIAGDGHLQVFDNAIEGVAARLRARNNVATNNIQRLSAASVVATQNGVRLASLDHVLDAIGTIKPGSGEGCFVFATSHGEAGRGLSLTMSNEVLSPRALDRALVQGCGNAPTAIGISGCFTGSFTQAPMNRTNRVVLIAARADRRSFGCGAGKSYTVYDKCLLDAFDAGGTWPQAYVSVQHCVIAEELHRQITPSEPQAWFGPAVANLPLPVRTGALLP